MAKYSAGIVMYRLRDERIQLLLVHPGGPFWAKKDTGAWSIPKGECDREEEDPLSVATREFQEETGYPVAGSFIPLGTLKQPGGKIVHAWATEGDCDASRIKSNTFSMEWPLRSRQYREFPEVDRAAWFDIATARSRLHKGLIGFIDRLLERLADGA